MYYIGHVAKAHGFNGSFSIKLNTSEKVSNLFLKIKQIYLENNPLPLNVMETKLKQKIFLRVKVHNIHSRELV